VDLIVALDGRYLIKVLKVKGLINHENIFKNLKKFKNTFKDYDRFITTFFATEEITLEEIDESMLTMENLLPTDSFLVFSAVFLPKKFKKYFPKTVILLAKSNFSKAKEESNNEEIPKQIQELLDKLRRFR